MRGWRRIPFSYLEKADRERLADEAGYRIAWTASQIYRRAPLYWMFPNRLEIMMRWEPI